MYRITLSTTFHFRNQRGRQVDYEGGTMNDSLSLGWQPLLQKHLRNCLVTSVPTQKDKVQRHGQVVAAFLKKTTCS